MIMFDIDGTLRDEQMGIPESAIKAIKECQQSHILVGICTGRTLSMVHDDVLNLKFDILITGDGSQIIINHQSIQDLYFDRHILQSILESESMKDVGLAIETKHKIYMNQKACEILKQENKEKGILSLSKEKIQYQNTLDDFHIETMLVSKICIWSKKKLMRQKNIQYVQCIEKEDCYYEMIHIDAGKGKAIEKVKQQLNIQSHEIMCFGDGLNDIGMFEVCGYCVAMKNSVSELIQIADEVCDEARKDGIFQTLKKMKIVRGKL